MNNEYFCSLIDKKDLNSIIPNYFCDEIGHQQNEMDLICLKQDCQQSGLICFRCQYHRHNDHSREVMPLTTFISGFINKRVEMIHTIQNNKEKIKQIQSQVENNIKEFLNHLTIQFGKIQTQMMKNIMNMEKEVQEMTMTSDIIMRKLMSQKHVPKYKFNKFLRDSLHKITVDDYTPRFEKISLLDYKQANEFVINHFDKTKQFEQKIKTQIEKLKFNLSSTFNSTDLFQINTDENYMKHVNSQANFEQTYDTNKQTYDLHKENYELLNQKHFQSLQYLQQFQIKPEDKQIIKNRIDKRIKENKLFQKSHMFPDI